jgi:ABC-type sugar transport system substrate-binding protein
MKLGWGLAIVGFSGCGYDPFGPPSRPNRSVVKDDPADKTRLIYMILKAVPNDETMAWALDAQTEANDNRAVFKVLGPKPDQNSSIQPEIIKRAIDDQASALLVDPGDSPELGKILAEVEASGIPVVLISRSIPAPEGSKPFTVVNHGSFDQPAAKILATTAEAAKKAGRPERGPVLVVSDLVTDRTSAARALALKEAATKAGYAKVIELAIDGPKLDESSKKIREVVDANPDLGVILTDDAESMRAACQVRQELKGKPIISVGGFLDFAPTKVMVPLDKASCAYMGRFSQLGTFATRALLSKMKGETVGPQVSVAPLFKQVDASDPAQPPPGPGGSIGKAAPGVAPKVPEGRP